MSTCDGGNGNALNVGGSLYGYIIAAGTPGSPGPEGPPGPPGPSGSAYEGPGWFFGEGVPGVVVGSKPGDLYMDLLTGTIYKLGD